MKTVENVPGLPDMYTIKSVTTSSGTRYFPQLDGRTLLRRSDGVTSVAWYPTFDDAKDALNEFLGRMQ